MMGIFGLSTNKGGDAILAIIRYLESIYYYAGDWGVRGTDLILTDYENNTFRITGKIEMVKSWSDVNVGLIIVNNKEVVNYSLVGLYTESNNSRSFDSGILSSAKYCEEVENSRIKKIILMLNQGGMENQKIYEFKISPNIQLKINNSKKEYSDGWVKINGHKTQILSICVKVGGKLREV